MCDDDPTKHLALMVTCFEKIVRIINNNNRKIALNVKNLAKISL
jgi:hypothetical protein